MPQLTFLLRKDKCLLGNEAMLRNHSLHPWYAKPAAVIYAEKRCTAGAVHLCSIVVY